ncbi:hypothetical protein GALMADRAFT_241076 [Galerina marginata CBS 339.88]|uniref:Transcription activator of gluconeogenesis ERT1 n=1 Tax=Galerina marginata (strain CBS 339.88) TaxID=685588 RepID=A0A067TNY7_GALM3|nr:hypothetical protein GALMADRAFT_241076 [Galerina marginata CBS 339.88]
MSSHLSVPISDNATSVWPRRASKACASCRRDKIRCDGARPCTACAKKGYTAEQCTDGCEPCRRARLRCEDGKPCRRCLELNIECTDESTISSQRSLTPPPANRTARGGDRAKLACSSCRRDNKKCDDQRPCSRCIARGEECIHVSRGPKLVKLRCEGCRDDNKRCEDSRPCRYCLESCKQCIIVPRKGRGHGTRVKAACTSCRRDKIRCNGDRPCTSCVKKGCECIERGCTACSRDGKTAECPHRKAQEAGLSDTGGDSTYPTETNVYRSQAPFQLVQPPMGLSAHGQDRRQWSSFVPGLQSHPLHPMYPNVVPQPQYYFPPQPSGAPNEPPFPMMQNSVFPGLSVQPSSYYYNVLDSSFGNNPPMPPNSRTGKQGN